MTSNDKGHFEYIRNLIDSIKNTEHINANILIDANEILLHLHCLETSMDIQYVTIKQLEVEIPNKHTNEVEEREESEDRTISNKQNGNVTIPVSVTLTQIKETEQEVTGANDAAFICQHIKRLDQEVLCLITIGRRGKLIKRHDLKVGIDGEVCLTAKDIFRQAILDNATSIVLVHNHSSGDLYPTKSDIKTTHKIIEASHAIGINLLDHVIIGEQSSEFPNGSVSMRTIKVCDFE